MCLSLMSTRNGNCAFDPLRTLARVSVIGLRSTFRWFHDPVLAAGRGALSRVRVKAVEALFLRADQPPQRAHFRATFGGVGAAPSGDYERAGEWVVRRSAFRILAMIMGRRAVSAVPANQA